MYRLSRLLFFAALLSCPLTSLSARAAAEPLPEGPRAAVFTSPIGWLGRRANLGMQFPVASSLGSLPIEVSLGFKGTYYNTGYQLEGCCVESGGSTSIQVRGFDAGLQLDLALNTSESIRWIESFDLRLGSSLTQTFGLPDATGYQCYGSPENSNCYPYTAQDSIKGIAFEIMAFARVPLGSTLFMKGGLGLVSEPHQQIQRFTTANPNATGGAAYHAERVAAANVEFDLGIALP